MGDGFWATCGASFALVFVAELGDKTQLAAFGLSAGGRQAWAVFAGSAAALVLASALAVGAGRILARWVDPRWLHYGGACLFVGFGLLMLVRGPEREEPETPTPGATEPAPPASAR